MNWLVQSTQQSASGSMVSRGAEGRAAGKSPWLIGAVCLQKCAGFRFSQEADQLSKLITCSHSINEKTTLPIQGLLWESNETPGMKAFENNKNKVVLLCLASTQGCLPVHSKPSFNQLVLKPLLAVLRTQRVQSFLSRKIAPTKNISILLWTIPGIPGTSNKDEKKCVCSIEICVWVTGKPPKGYI